MEMILVLFFSFLILFFKIISITYNYTLQINTDNILPATMSIIKYVLCFLFTRILFLVFFVGLSESNPVASTTNMADGSKFSNVFVTTQQWLTI